MKKSQIEVKSKTPKIQLSKEEINAVKKRMAQLRKDNTERNTSTQALIPYRMMYPDGTCYIEGKKYSQTVEFYDTNYQLATFDEKGSKFSSWCDILNYFDDSIEFQNTYENQIMDKDLMILIMISEKSTVIFALIICLVETTVEVSKNILHSQQKLKI